MPDEDDKERIDRELIELLNELRIALPGVQVLFAFLLILPFQERFVAMSSAEHAVYTVALASSAIAAALLIAPSMYHRLNFRVGVKEQMLFDSNKLAITGILATAVGVVCAIFLVIDMVYGSTVALAATIAMAVIFIVLWLVLPIVRRVEES